MSISQALWQDNAELAHAALRHPFVRGLADGSLPRDRFVGYVAQDAFFLESFARAYAFALAHSPDQAGIEAFADLLTGVREELRLHATYARRWDIDLARVEPTPATLAYTDFLLATAAVGGVGRTCAAMTPCMRLYAYLGQSLATTQASGVYHEWIKAYADPAFETLASTLEQLLDKYAENAESVAGTYARAMRLELDFFESAYRGRQQSE